MHISNTNDKVRKVSRKRVHQLHSRILWFDLTGLYTYNSMAPRRHLSYRDELSDNLSSMLVSHYFNGRARLTRMSCGLVYIKRKIKNRLYTKLYVYIVKYT